MHPWSGMYGWPWPAVLWIIAFLLFWGGLLALLIWALRQSAGSRRESAEDILRRRIANGDITQEEYERIRNILRE